MRSIRTYLLRTLIVSMLVITSATALFSFFNVSHEVNELYDKNMQELGMTILSQIPHDHMHNANGNYAISATRKKLKGEEEFLIQLWEDGELYYSSHPAIAFPLQTPADMNQQGIFTKEFENRPWLVYQVKRDNRIVQISQRRRLRTGFVTEIAIRMLVPMLLQIPLLSLLIWFAVAKSLRPLNLISENIKQRTAVSLTALPTEIAPQEVRPLVEELNELLVRLGNALEAQRRFIADAAHELRTPLAALQLQLNILNRANNNLEKTKFVENLQQGINRTAHLVHQLLTLARLEPGSTEQPPPQTVDLEALVRRIVAQYADIAMEKKVDLGVARLEPLQIEAYEQPIQTLLSNLVDNAVRFTPAEGHVTISVYQKDAHTVFEVEDTGVGIPAHERSKIFQRFHRILGTQVDGTGLGLAIVQNIVELHGGSIEVTDGAGAKGTLFRVLVPVQKRSIK